MRPKLMMPMRPMKPMRLIRPARPLMPLRPTRLKPLTRLMRPKLMKLTRLLMQIWPKRLISLMRPIWPTRPVWPTRPLLQLTPPSRIFAVLAFAFLSNMVATVEVSDDSLSNSPSQNKISKTCILSFFGRIHKNDWSPCSFKDSVDEII